MPTFPARPLLPSGRSGPPRCRASGFTLLEVLVSVIILSFGLLGLAGLQAASLKLSREAQLQSTAVLFAREYAELMRNNNQVSVLTDKAENGYLIDKTSSKPSAPTACLSSPGCNSTEVATWDQGDWLTRVLDALPGGIVEVCFDSAPFTASGADEGLPKAFGTCSDDGDTIMIKIGWQQIEGEATTTGTFSRSLQEANNIRPSIILPVVPGGAV